MRIEHVALNVPDPVAMARWYVEHLGLRVALGQSEAPWAHFLADDAGTMIELYRNDDFPVPDYPSQPPAILHLAFHSADPEADRARLEPAGATYHSEVRDDSGSLLIILRDPWGVPVQLCRRGTPLVP